MLTLETGCSNCGKSHAFNARAWYRGIPDPDHTVYQVQVDPVVCECGMLLELIELQDTEVELFFAWYAKVEVERVGSFKLA